MEINIDRALNITGWMTPHELGVLATIAKGCENLIIEAGCYQGRSTRAMADNIHPQGIIIAVDPWDCNIHDSSETSIVLSTDETTRQMFYLNNFKHIKAGRIIMAARKFEDINPTEFQEPDFIFIDADHRYEAVCRDIEHAIKFNPKLLGGHDFSNDWPGVKKAVDEKFGRNIQVEETIWLTKLR